MERVLHQPKRPFRRGYEFDLIGVHEPFLTGSDCIEQAARSVISDLGLSILGIPTRVPGDLGGIIFQTSIEAQSTLTVVSFPYHDFIEAIFRTGLSDLPSLKRFGSLLLDKFQAEEVDLKLGTRSKLLIARDASERIIAQPRPPRAVFLQAQKSA